MFDDVQNLWLFAAGVAAALTALIHIFGGGPENVRPLLRSNDIADVPKYVNYYCWHLVTLTITAMATGLIWASLDPTQTGLAWMWTIMAILFTLWSLVLIKWKGQKLFHMPQWTLFGVVSVLAVIGLAT
ncbi:hypothetical protein SAMN05444287_0738 [Octadecabacter temperatus]|jgi:hypothetical protein|uniref:Uncharacterized protein n=1 Tax=Octadecabacter temperatus TaxID=1458307 RepID=A0A0K0Y3Y3_9RHOB|nr:hypothetical protein [Octadecabacter temperatus]AKS45640.1 hypothetical protein OSB_10840 [Octadecabacter temperatus]SIN97394.1 hypothetical protein SAMN05444287_0738 [Octadecabacter temperatus]